MVVRFGEGAGVAPIAHPPAKRSPCWSASFKPHAPCSPANTTRLMDVVVHVHASFECQSRTGFRAPPQALVCASASRLRRLRPQAV